MRKTKRALWPMGLIAARPSTEPVLSVVEVLGMTCEATVSVSGGCGTDVIPSGVEGAAPIIFFSGVGDC
jgi:hypothetical protein